MPTASNCLCCRSTATQLLVIQVLYKLKQFLKKCLFILFNRFSWLHGAYGITGPNKKIRHLHFYVTVEGGKPHSEVYQEIKEEFLKVGVDLEPKEYFELLQKAEKEQNFQFLVTPGFVGGIMVGRRDGPFGTLTMFCYQDKRHYALTCFHLGCLTHPPFQAGISWPQWLQIRDEQDYFKQHVKGQQYYYNEREIGNLGGINNRENCPLLGSVHNTSIDGESDIMSIEVPNDVKIHCELAEIERPNWLKIWRELPNRVTADPKHQVQVEKDGYASRRTHGHIHPYGLFNQGPLENAVVIVKNDANDPPFLEPGDSGALVWFHDENGRKQAFAYGIGKADEINEAFPDEGGPYYICFKLNTGLKKLGLSNAGCFRKCGGNN